MKRPETGAPPIKTSGSSELKKRVVAAVIMAFLAVATNFGGGFVFAVFWTAAAVAVAYEWQKLTGGTAFAARLGLAIAGTCVAALGAFYGNVIVTIAGLGLSALGAVPAMAGARMTAATGGLYAALVVVSIILCRDTTTAGMVTVFWLFAIVWGTDVMAYFTGRALGGPKLWPRVSPKKTWSGALGGLAAAIVLGSLVLMVAGYGFRWSNIVMAVVISAASQLGDLFESAVKRRYDAKDSSQLIPGHGGVMDRLDGFIFAVVLAAVIGVLLGGISNVPRGLLGIG